MNWAVSLCILSAKQKITPVDSRHIGIPETIHTGVRYLVYDDFSRKIQNIRVDD